MITQARKIEHEKKVLIVETLFRNKSKTLRLHEVLSLKSASDSIGISTYDTPIAHTIGPGDELTGAEAEQYKKRLMAIIQNQFYADSN